MISYQSLLAEIEKYVSNAKNIKDEQELREQLSAVRALCDVALSMKNANQQKQNLIGNSAMSMPQQQQPQQQLNGASNQSQPTSAFGQENAGANGQSIFDF